MRKKKLEKIKEGNKLKFDTLMALTALLYEPECRTLIDKHKNGGR
jgi:hypothetical protein